MRSFAIILAILALCIVSFSLLPSLRDGSQHGAGGKPKIEANMLIVAAKAYAEEYGKPPESDNRSILRKLHGENPRKIVFIEIYPRDITEKGDFLDPWGTPYVFDLSTTSPWAYSFGHNKLDEGGNGDDVASWK